MRLSRLSCLQVVLIFSLKLSSVWAATPESLANRDQFLQKMGFEDISAQIEETLKSKIDFDSPKSKEILIKSKERYEILNLARQLAVEIYSLYEDRVAQAKTVQEKANIQYSFLKLIAKLTDIAPQAIDENLPRSLGKLDTTLESQGNGGRTLLEKRTQYVTTVLLQQIYEQAETLTMDILEVAVGSEKMKETLSNLLLSDSKKTFELSSKIHKEVAQYLEIVNTDLAIGFSKYLGSALTLTAIHEARLSFNIYFEKLLARTFKQKGLILGNYISNEIELPNDKNSTTKIKVENGAIVAEYSTGRTAKELAIAASVKNNGGRWAFVKGFIGGFFTESDVTKISSDDDLSEIRSKRDLEQEKRDMDPKINSGYSHAGIAFVYHDKQTGLSRVEVRDVFPDETYGGVRKIGIEAFSVQGTGFRVAIANVDSVKFSKVIEAQTSLSGRTPDPIKLAKIAFLSDGKIADVNQYISVQSQVSQREVRVLAKAVRSLPETVYPFVASRVRKVWDKFLTVDGLGFGYSLGHALGHADSAQAIRLAYFLSTGVDPHVKKGIFNENNAVAAAVDTSEFARIKSTDRDVTTAKTFLEQDIYQALQNVEFPRMSYHDRLDLPFQAFHEPLFDLLDAYSAILAAKESFFTGSKVQTLKEKLAASLDMNAVLIGNPRYFRDPQNYAYLSTRKPEGKIRFLSKQQSSSSKALERIEAIQSGNLDTEIKAMEDYLSQLGFKDLAPELDPLNGVNPISKRTIMVSKERFEIVNTARVLAARLLALVSRDLSSNQELRKRFINYAANLMVLAPPAPTRHVPGEIRALTDNVKRLDEFRSHLAKTAFKNSRERQVGLVSNFLHVLFTENNSGDILSGAKPGQEVLLKEVSVMGGLYSRYLQRTMLDPLVGYTYWLGRAVALLVKKYSIETGDDAIFKELAQAAGRNGVEIDNYVGNKLVIRSDQDDRGQVVEVQTGDYIFERSDSWESAMILGGAGADTKKLGNGKDVGLDGGFWQVLLNVANSDLSNGASDRQRYNKIMSRADGLNGGFSHVGMAIVNEAQVLTSKGEMIPVQSTFIYDNYPYPGDYNSGGVRYLGIEHFANPFDVLSIGVASIDDEKFFQEAKRQYQERLLKYKKVLPDGSKDDFKIWTSVRPKVDETKTEEQMFVVSKYSEKDQVTWDPVITADEYTKLIHSKDAATFMKEWRARVLNGAEEMLKRGTYFNWMNDGSGKLKNPVTGKEEVITGQSFEGGAYCSQTLYLTMYMFTGVDIEPVKSDWTVKGKFLADMKVSQVETMGLKKSAEQGAKLASGKEYSPIISPVSLALQKYIRHVSHISFAVKSFTQLTEDSNLPRQSIEDERIAFALMRDASFRETLKDLQVKNVEKHYEIENLGEHLFEISAMKSSMRGGKLTNLTGGTLEEKEED